MERLLRDSLLNYIDSINPDYTAASTELMTTLNRIEGYHAISMDCPQPSRILRTLVALFNNPSKKLQVGQQIIILAHHHIIKLLKLE